MFSMFLANFGENCDVDGTLQRACTGNSQCTVVGDGKICDCLYWQSWNFFSEMCVSNAGPLLVIPTMITFNI